MIISNVMKSGLETYLKDRNCQRVFLCGLAFDFCVRYTAEDACLRCGFKAVVIEDLSRSVDLPNTVEDTKSSFAKTGVELLKMK